ncbi:MAG: ABC transporter permease [Ilumatobacteraceae bacterium]
MERFSFIGRRLLQAVPVILAVLAATFLLLKLVPGDPAIAVAGPRATPAAIAAVRRDMGLDQPVWTQFGNYLHRVVRGDLGDSAVSGVPVTELLRQNGPVTLWVLITGSLVAIGIAVPCALVAARRPGSAGDQVVRIGSLFGLTVPPFWVGIMLLSFVAARTGWFPIGGWPASSTDRLRTVALPAITLGIAVSPVLIRSLRTSLIEVFNADHVISARAAGIEGWTLTRRFVLRNSFVPTVALLATTVAYLLFGTVLVEATFGLPGLGQTMVQASVSRDFSVVQGLTLVFALGTIIVNLIGDLALTMLDPRIRVSS